MERWVDYSTMYADAFWHAKLPKRTRPSAVRRQSLHLGVACPYRACRAGPGEPCIFPGQDNANGRMIHQPRISYARGAEDERRLAAFADTYDGRSYARWLAYLKVRDEVMRTKAGRAFTEAMQAALDKAGS